MDCCGLGHTVAHDPFIWGIPLAPIGAMLAGEVGPRGSTEKARMAENASAALDVLRKSISFDVHSHGGSPGIASKGPPNGELANAMRAGSLPVACLADVPGLARGSDATQKGRLLWCARRRRANFTVTTSTALPGSTN